MLISRKISLSPPRPHILLRNEIQDGKQAIVVRFNNENSRLIESN